MGLHKTLEKYLLPAIAMNGADAIFEDTWEIIRDLYHENSSIWVTESDCLEAYQSFELLIQKLTDIINIVNIINDKYLLDP